MTAIRCPYCHQWLRLNWFFPVLGKVKTGPGGNRIEWNR